MSSGVRGGMAIIAAAAVNDHIKNLARDSANPMAPNALIWLLQLFFWLAIL